MLLKKWVLIYVSAGLILGMSTVVQADTYTYTCRDRLGHVSYGDHACGNRSQEVSHGYIKPTPVVGSIRYHQVNQTTINNIYQPHNPDILDYERQKQEDQDKAWNSLPPLGVTPQKSPGTWYKTHSAY